MVEEQILSYRINWVDTTQPLQSGFVGTMKLIINVLCQLRLYPELMERVHIKVWHQRRTANHNTEQVWQTSRERASDIQNSFVKGLEIKEFRCISSELLVTRSRSHLYELIFI